ncbi:MFS transporter [Variovorax sp. OV329]|uniref:MFS transporter n=1 Tax=Variovorax sp. OV329 TaxID=1882825 RepID=UPI0008E6AAC1|nr:MFS transporter [Variovorax sp. OV329]SFM02135.1 drug resistance transporter, EmrB/QacA subfamily [Variovorax sp. OV329]
MRATSHAETSQDRRADQKSASIKQAEDSALSKEHRLVILVLMVGVFLPLLDATAVNIALSAMSTNLAVPLSTIQWVSTAYMLSAAAVVPLSAWAAKRLGGKRTWIAGLFTFLIGSTLAAFAWSAEALVVFRIVQGIGAGFLMPIMQTVLVRSVGQHNAKAALASMAVPSVIAPILGPLVGGLALHYGGWRYIFLLNIPLCLLGICMALRHLRTDNEFTKVRFDAIGFLLLCPGIALTIYGLSTLGEIARGVSSMGVMLGVAGMVLSATFVLYVKKWAPRPLIDLKMFSVPSFRSSAWLLFLSSLVFYGGLLALPLYFLQSCGFGTIETSALLALQGIGTMASRRYLVPLSQRLGTSGLALVSIAASILGTIPFLWPSGAEHVGMLAASVLVRGAGLGILTILALSTAYRDVDHSLVADASAATRILTNLGAAVGTASVLAVLQYGIRTAAVSSDQTGFILAFGYLMVISLACALPAAKLKA